MKNREFYYVLLCLLSIIVLWVKLGYYLGKKVSPLEIEGRKTKLFTYKIKEKAPKREDFEAFVVEISGIEPLTS